MTNVLGTLGLAMKAGQVASGEYQTEEAIKKGSARLVVIAKDASDGTKKRFKDSCKHYGVSMVIAYDKDALGWAIGKTYRASLAIKDVGLADTILEKIDGEVYDYGKNENI